MQAVNPVLVCYGTELFMRDEYIEGLINRLIDPNLRDFAVVRYDLAETPLAAVLEEVETAPFMVERKIVIAKGATFLTGAKDTSKVEHQPERLLAYLQQPVDFAILVLLVDAEKLDERKKLVKTLKERKLIKMFLPLAADDLPAWATERAGKSDVIFAKDALERFVLYTGGQLQMMSSELDKLVLYAGEDKKITLQMVEEMVVRGTEQNVFVMMEDIVHKRMAHAFEILHELLKQREEPIRLIMLIARQFRLILQVKDLAAQGYSQAQIATSIGSHPYPVKLAGDQGRKYDITQLRRILTAIAELDYQMKSGKVDKVVGLEMFFLQLHHRF